MSTTESEKMSRNFYDQLGAKRLAERTTPEWDRKIISNIMEMLSPGQRILDVGCGYGRITIPLAMAGYDIVGLDISCQLLQEAKRLAKCQGVKVSWMKGSMCGLPLLPSTFDVALCLWSVFNELLTEHEQLLAARGIYDVLCQNGWALFEGPQYIPPTNEEIETGKRYGEENRVRADHINGLPNHHYLHDVHSFGRLMAKVKITKYDVYAGEKEVNLHRGTSQTRLNLTLQNTTKNHLSTRAIMTENEAVFMDGRIGGLYDDLLYFPPKSATEIPLNLGKVDETTMFFNLFLGAYYRIEVNKGNAVFDEIPRGEYACSRRYESKDKPPWT